MARRGNASTNVTMIVALILALAALGLGVFLAVQRHDWSLLAGGAAGVVLVLVGWAVTGSIAAAGDHTLNGANEALAPVNDRLQQLAVLVTQISEQQLLSDRAKAVAYRNNDREALRRAIREDMASQDWEAAHVLANDMEAQFGYKQEADRLRQEIHTRQDQVVRRQIGEVLAVIDRHTRVEQWGAAIREAENLAQSYGNHELVRNLPQEIENRRQATKQQLLTQWHGRNPADYDSGIELLKRLDIYLTPQEAETLQESVRGVFRAKLEGLRTQFGAAWQEQRYTDALTLAEQIVSDFPNAKIAQEVNEKMNVLRQLAAKQRQPTAPEPAGT